MSTVTVVSHPLVAHSLTILRDKTTSTEVFRRHAGIVSKILILEATKQLALRSVAIETPLTPTKGVTLKDEVVVVPVLRAGLAMLFALNDFLPAVNVGFVGLERDEKTAVAREYYRKLPRLFITHKVLVIDPMLATGGSFDDTLRILKNKGAKHLTVVCVVASQQGIKRLQQNHPNVPIITAAIDARLDDKAYIVPGLGDFGDRYFGTEP